MLPPGTKKLMNQLKTRQVISLKVINLFDVVTFLYNSLIYTNFNTNYLHNVFIFTMYVLCTTNTKNV